MSRLAREIPDRPARQDRQVDSGPVWKAKQDGGGGSLRRPKPRRTTPCRLVTGDSYSTDGIAERAANLGSWLGDISISRRLRPNGVFFFFFFPGDQRCGHAGIRQLRWEAGCDLGWGPGSAQTLISRVSRPMELGHMRTKRAVRTRICRGARSPAHGVNGKWRRVVRDVVDQCARIRSGLRSHRPAGNCQAPKRLATMSVSATTTRVYWRTADCGSAMSIAAGLPETQRLRPVDRSRAPSPLRTGVRLVAVDSFLKRTARA